MGQTVLWNRSPGSRTMNKKYLPVIAAVVVCVLVVGASLVYGRRALTTPIRRVLITSPFPLLYDSAQISSSSLALLDAGKLRAHILQKNRDVSTVIIEKSYPESLLITALARKPIALVSMGERVRAIDEDGVLLMYIPEQTGALPTLDAPGIPFYADQKADWRVATVVSYLQMFQREHIVSKEISIDPASSQFRFLLEENIRTVMPFSGNPGAIVASLQVILGRFRIEGKQVHTVDFRFDKPIITFQNGEKISS